MSEQQDQEFFTQLVTESKKETYTQEESDQITQDAHRIMIETSPETSTPFPNYFFSGFWIRSFAFLIDLMCIGALTTIITQPFLTFNVIDQTTSLLSVYGILGFCIYYGYFILLTKYNHGQTIGKMIFGIRVVSLKTATLDWQTVLIRELCGRFLLSLPVIGLCLYIPILFTKQKQQVADLFCDTSVVKLSAVAAFLHQTSETATVQAMYEQVNL